MRLTWVTGVPSSHDITRTLYRVYSEYIFSTFTLTSSLKINLHLSAFAASIWTSSSRGKSLLKAVASH